MFKKPTKPKKELYSNNDFISLRITDNNRHLRNYIDYLFTSYDNNMLITLFKIMMTINIQLYTLPTLIEVVHRYNKNIPKKLITIVHFLFTAAPIQTVINKISNYISKKFYPESYNEKNKIFSELQENVKQVGKYGPNFGTHKRKRRSYTKTPYKKMSRKKLSHRKRRSNLQKKMSYKNFLNKKIAINLREMKEGKLISSGHPVRNRKQAIAISYSQARKAYPKYN